MTRLTRVFATWNPGMWVSLSGISSIAAASEPLWLSALGVISIAALLAAAAAATIRKE